MRFSKRSVLTLSVRLMMTIGTAALANGAEQFVVRTWQAEDGLPQNSGTAIAQTSDGYLWIGTFNGLVRFNGVDFTRFTIGNTKELLSGDINELYADRAGRLWIGTASGLASYEHGQFKHWRTPTKLSRATIHNFAETRGGDLIVTADEGVWRVANGQATELTIPEALWPTGSSLAAASPEGDVWVAHNRDLYRLEGKEPRLQARVKNLIGLLLVGRDGTIWYRHSARLIQWKPNQPPLDSEFEVGKVSALLETGDGDLWIGSAENGLFRWRDGKLASVTTSEGLGSNRILTLAQDRENNLWVGTDGGGFSRVRRAQLTTYTKEHGLSFPDVMSIAEDRTGRVWLGIYSGALCVGENGQWQRFHAPEILDDDETVSSLWPSRDGTLWVGRYARSLCRIREGRSEPELRSQVSRIRALFEDREGGLWIGSANQGLEHFQGDNTLRWNTTNGLSNDYVTAIAQDAGGAIWVGTGNGLNRIQNGRVEQFFEKNGLGSSQIHCLFTDGDGALWIGTPGAGITRYRDGRFATATSQSGLHSDVVGQILEDDSGHLWIGSTTGIFRVEKQSLHDVLDGRSQYVRNTVYGRKDGMRAAGCPGSFQPLCAKTRDGRLWFCTSAGVTVIDPRALRRTELPPPVHIERLLVDGVELTAGTNFAQVLASGMPREWRGIGTQQTNSAFRTPHSELGAAPSHDEHSHPLVIPSGSRRLEIQCAALNFTDPAQAQFKFWLEGYEDEWHEAGTRRVAHYTGIPPGQYRFHAKAANLDGVWNEADAVLALVIQPSWRQSVWFRSLAALAGLGVLIAAYRLRVGSLHQARAQQADFSRRLIESQEAERKRIAGELHDSLGQSLLVINNRSKLAMTGSAPPDVAQEQLRQISSLASQAIEEVRTIAQNLRPYQLDRLGLTRALHFLLQNISSVSAIRVVDEIDPVDNLLARETEIHLFRIAQEFLNNMMKYSEATEVRVSIRREARKVHFSFEENGRGFDLRAGTEVRGQALGLGLQSMTERLRILGSKFDFQSQPGQGTKLRFSLPIPDQAHGPAN